MSAEDTPSPTLQQGAAIFERLMSGQTLGGMLGHSPESEDALYYLAHTFYNQGKYADAMRMFAYLVTINHLERRYYSGFAACLQMQHRHADAVKYYGLASILDLSDPRAPMHMAECHLALGDQAQGRQAIDYALALARRQDNQAALVARLEAMLAFLDAETAPKAKPAASDTSKENSNAC